VRLLAVPRAAIGRQKSDLKFDEIFKKFAEAVV
jgi:hypothetical protein